jgi:DNA-directed RNA polymerase specialized sigma24 family protein
VAYVKEDVSTELTRFEAERPRLTAIATRILGSPTDTDDVLQEARLRLTRTHHIDDLPAWLTAVVTRLCLDHLRKRHTRSNFEAQVPTDDTHVDPEADGSLAERAGDAMEVVLDTLAPAERVAPHRRHALVQEGQERLCRASRQSIHAAVLATMPVYAR